MYEEGVSLSSHFINHIFHHIIGLKKITAINADPFYSFKTLYHFIGIGCSGFVRSNTNAPSIILYQVNNWQLVQGSKLEGF
jgi:hypothetical protein